MTTLASLVVRLGGDVSEFVSEVTKADIFAERAFKRIESGAKSLAGNLAGILSIGAFAKMTKDAIDNADKMNDLSKKYGIATETLSGFSLALKTNGASMEDLGVGLKSMSKFMDEANRGGQRQNDVFRALGVAYKDTTTGALLPADKVLTSLAESFAGLEDGPGKTAVAVEIFGKSAAALIPFLDEGAAGLKKWMDNAEQLGIVVDSKTAAAADEFNDTLTLLHAGLEGVFTRAVKEVLPAFQGIADIFLKTAKNGETLSQGAAVVSTMLKLLATGALVVVEAFKTVGTVIGAVFAAIGQAFQGNFRQAFNILTDNTIGESQAATWEQIKSVWGSGATTIGALAEGMGNRTKKAFNGVADVSKQAEELAAVLAKIFAKEGGFTADFEKQMKILNDGFERGAISAELLDEAKTALLKQQPFYVAALKKEADAIEHISKMQAARLELELEEINARDDMLNTLDDMVAAMETELAVLGKTCAERALYILSLQKEKDLKLALDAKDVERINRQYETLAALVKQREAMEDQLSVVMELSDGVGNFARTLLEPGKSIDYLRAKVKQLASDLLYIFAKRWFLQMVAGVTGNGSIASQAAAVGQGTVSGALGQMGGSVIGAGVSALGGAIGGSFGAGMTYGASVGAVGAFSELGGAGSLAFQLGAVAPYLAALAIAVYFLADTFKDVENPTFRLSQGTGGPGAFGGISASGNYGVEGWNQVLSQVNQFDERLSAFLSPEQQANIANRLSAYTRGGQRWDGQPATFAFPPGDSTAVEQVTMELLRSRYAAVFEELNPQFAELIRNFEGTSSELATLIDQLAGVYATIDALTSSDVLGDAATLYANSIGGIGRAVENNIANLDAAIAAYDGTASSVTALTNATIDYYNAAAAAIAQTMAIGKAIDEMFGNTRRTVEMSGLDTQGQYNYLQAEADRLFEQLLGSSDPTDIQRLAERINNDISSAFGLLSPEEQAQMSQQFLDRIDSVNQAVQDRLKEITEGMAEQTRTDLARIRELFEGVAAENAGAAAKMSVAGDVMLEAARTPQTLYIVNGNATEVGGGGA